MIGYAIDSTVDPRRQPSQSKFFFDDKGKTHWVWRVEYRVQLKNGEWSDWGVYSRRPNVFIRKCDAERRLRKIDTNRGLTFTFEFAVHPHYVGYDAREAKRNATKAKRDRALKRMWAESRNNEIDRDRIDLSE